MGEGGLFYPEQIPEVLIGSKSGTTRTAVALTDSYGVANKTKIFNTGGHSEVVLDVLYTTGAGETSNSVEIRLRDSIDGVNFYTLTNESASGGTSTLTQREFTFVGASAATAYAFSYRLDVSYKYLEISVKESGVETNAGTIFVEALLSGR